jgi:hypothetical protein
MKIILSLLITFSLVACSKIPITQQRKSVRIEVGPGPEDIVLDTISTTYPRLFVSCSQRRKNNPNYGEICEVNLNNDNYKILKRLNEPAGMVFHPHGIDLVKNVKGEILLYCVSHNTEKKEHSIIIYKVVADHLEFKEKLDSPLLVSPNDVTADCAGQIFVTNDAHKHGNSMEQLLKLKKGNMVFYRPENKKWEIGANRFCYANGIAAVHCPADYVLLSTSRSNKLYKLQNVGDNKVWYFPKVIAKLKGLDNITFLNENEVLVTAHLKQIALVKHVKDAKNFSPTVVYRVNITNGKYKVVYANNGSDISAGSTALYYKGKLYISQIFEPFLLKCDAADLK